MARANFSESSFGFAYTHELFSLWRNHLIKEAPYFPSTYEEGKEGGKGYDVKLTSRGFIYCAQFKRSEWIDSPHGREVLHISQPYYRFGIGGGRNRERGSNQHEVLLALEKKDVKVEYVVPRFIDRCCLDDFFIKGKLREKVFRLKPSVIKKLPDDEKHFIVSNPSWTVLKRCSEAIELEGPYDWGEITEKGLGDDSIDIGEDSSRIKKTVVEKLEDAGEEMISFLEKGKESVVHKTSRPKPLKFYPMEADAPVFTSVLESSDVRSVRSFYSDNFRDDPVGTLREMFRVLLGAELFVFSEEHDYCD